MKRLYDIVIVIILVIMAITCFSLYNTKRLTNKASFTNNLVLVNNETSDSSELENHREYYDNKDIVAKITIDDLKIDSLVAKGNDNEYYLGHNLFKNDDKYGSIFMDYRNDLLSSKQINIYGHNSHYYDIPFSRLDAYLEEEYYKKNKYIYLETDYDTRKYEIYAVYGVLKNDNEHMALEFTDEEEYEKHFIRMKNKSIYDTGVTVDGSDKILTIQTCLYNYDKGKYLVINAKEVMRIKKTYY